MMGVQQSVFPNVEIHDRLAWPGEAVAMMKRADQLARPNQRRLPRWDYRVRGDLTLAGEETLSGPTWPVFTRDINPWCCGFITHQIVPVYRKAMLRLPTPHEQVLHIRCLVRRCRQFAPGWYQAMVEFEREEMIFLV